MAGLIENSADDNSDVAYGIQEPAKGNFSERASGMFFYKLFEFSLQRAHLPPIRRPRG